MKLNFTQQGAGAPIILLHGMFGSLSNLGNLARVLAGNYRVISVDLRNHGESPHEQRMDLEVMALDIVELLDALEIDSAALVGHSLGGKVAMQVAMNNPSRVSCLLVADIAPVDYPQQVNDAVLSALQQLSGQVIDSRKAADAVLAKFPIDAPTRGFVLKNLRRLNDRQFDLKLNMQSISANYATELTRAPVGQPYSGATLFVKGENSAYIQAKHRVTIETLFPCSNIAVIEGAGHWLHAEQPERFNNLLCSFLSANL
ncbi:MAG: alpha/beta fold hydrolase [Porticoccaceae bacterium]